MHRPKSSLPARALQALRDSTKPKHGEKKQLVGKKTPPPVVNTKLGNVSSAASPLPSSKVQDSDLKESTPAPTTAAVSSPQQQPQDKTLETRKSAIQTAQIIASENAPDVSPAQSPIIQPEVSASLERGLWPTSSQVTPGAENGRSSFWKKFLRSLRW